MAPYIGYALRDANLPYAGIPDWTGVEIDFARACHPLRTEPYLAGLDFQYVSLHTLELSVAGPQPPEERYLDALAAVADENGATSITDHLGFTHGERRGAAAGHVMTPPLVKAALDATCRNINCIQSRFGSRRFFLENLAHFFVLEGDIEEAEFFRRIFERTGCGLLLDATNVHANAHNFGIDPRAFIAAVVDAAPAIQMHLAGGFVDDASGRYVDSHSEPIHDEVWQLYREALALGGDKVEAVFIERDWNFPAAEGWTSEVHRARVIAEEVAAMPAGARP